MFENVIQHVYAMLIHKIQFELTRHISYLGISGAVKEVTSSILRCNFI